MKNANILIFLVIFLLFLSKLTAMSQERQARWQRSEPATQPELQLFHSPVAIDLPTATTLQKWDFEFEVSHRFIPTTGSGFKNFYGLDGPAHIRLAFGFAPTDRMVIKLGRTNFNDNIDLWLKYKFLQIRHPKVPFLVAIKVGGAWNSYPEYPEIQDRSRTAARNYQAFGQVIINTLIGKKLGIGLVPSYLYNTDIRWGPETGTTEIKDTFRMGTYLQYYVSPLWSVLWEWSPYISGYKSLVAQEYNPMSFGIELETGGHFFKIFLSNSQYINSTQYLAGADIPIDRNDWRIGFMITRLLKFVK
jgi:hypothetical protein